MYFPGLAWLVVLMALGIYYFTVWRRPKNRFGEGFFKNAMKDKHGKRDRKGDNECLK